MVIGVGGLFLFSQYVCAASQLAKELMKPILDCRAVVKGLLTVLCIETTCWRVNSEGGYSLCAWLVVLMEESSQLI